MAASRTENFQPEIAVPGANGATDYLTNAVIIRKLPEANFSSRPQQVKSLPLWFSFDSSAGFMSRSQPGLLGQHAGLQLQDVAIHEAKLRMDPRVRTAFHLWGINFAPSFRITRTRPFTAKSFQALTPSGTGSTGRKAATSSANALRLHAWI